MCIVSKMSRGIRRRRRRRRRRRNNEKAGNLGRKWVRSGAARSHMTSSPVVRVQGGPLISVRRGMTPAGSICPGGYPSWVSYPMRERIMVSLRSQQQQQTLGAGNVFRSHGWKWKDCCLDLDPWLCQTSGRWCLDAGGRQGGPPMRGSRILSGWDLADRIRHQSREEETSCLAWLHENEVAIESPGQRWLYVWEQPLLRSCTTCLRSRLTRDAASHPPTWEKRAGKACMSMLMIIKPSRTRIFLAAIAIGRRSSETLAGNTKLQIYNLAWHLTMRRSYSSTYRP